MQIRKEEYFFLLYLSKTQFNRGILTKPKFGSFSAIENDLLINFPSFNVSQGTLIAYLKKYVELGLIQRELIRDKRDMPVNGYTVNKSELVKYIKKTDIYTYTRDFIKENGTVLD